MFTPCEAAISSVSLQSCNFQYSKFSYPILISGVDGATFGRKFGVAAKLRTRSICVYAVCTIYIIMLQ